MFHFPPIILNSIYGSFLYSFVLLAIFQNHRNIKLIENYFTSLQACSEKCDTQVQPLKNLFL